LSHTLYVSGHARLLPQGSIPTLDRESLPDAEAPVDGGVFDIPGNGSPVEVVPIAAKLALLRLSSPARSTLSECPFLTLRNSSYPMIFLALRYWEWGNVPE
jgi:hypothetical protein